MTDQLQPLTVYRYHDGPFSPNPWKVVIFLYELQLPWKMLTFDRADPDVRKKEPMASMTPNGRMPVLQDPNTDICLWESGAIIEYLLETYDTQHRLSYTSPKERHQQRAWVHFQVSGQGPYFGQRAWFLMLHHETLPSAQERYAEEIKRVLGVIDHHLAKTNQKWLVGEKLCAADLMFVPWNCLILMFLLGPAFESEWKEKYPHCWEWHQAMLSIDSVKKAQELASAGAATQPADSVTKQAIATVAEVYK